MFTYADPGTCRPGPWGRLDYTIHDGSNNLFVWELTGVGVVAQAESPAQAEAAAGYLAGQTGQRAVVATQPGWENPGRFLELGVNTVLVEAYGPEGYPYGDVDRMVWQAHHDGWPHVIPVVGCYHGYPLSAYSLAGYRRRFGVWSAESMTDDDWQRLASLAQ